MSHLPDIGEFQRNGLYVLIKHLLPITDCKRIKYSGWKLICFMPFPYIIFHKHLCPIYLDGMYLPDFGSGALYVLRGAYIYIQQIIYCKRVELKIEILENCASNTADVKKSMYFSVLCIGQARSL